MFISTKGRNALSVMADLARHNDGKNVVLMDIAKRQGLSEKYLEGIVASLSRAGLVISQRGPGGGYRLSRDPSEYTVGSILRLSEGALDLVPCVADGECTCGQSCDCVTLPLWQNLGRLIDDYLDGISLEDLVNGRVEPPKQ